MDPRPLGAGFRIAVLILGTALLMLPFQRAGSAEQVVTVLAAAVGALFIVTVTTLARLSASRPPIPPGDKTRRPALNGPSRVHLPPGGDKEEEGDT